MRLLGVPRHVILAAEALGAMRAAELPVTRVHHAKQKNINKRFTINHWRMYSYRMWIELLSSIDLDPESGFAIKLDVEHIFAVSEPVPFVTPGSGMGKKSGSGSGMNNPDHISESLKFFFLS
jgi:hypothetical protein